MEHKVPVTLFNLINKIVLGKVQCKNYKKVVYVILYTVLCIVLYIVLQTLYYAQFCEGKDA